jgi:hypothetical protein
MKGEERGKRASAVYSQKKGKSPKLIITVCKIVGIKQKLTLASKA